MNEEEEAWHAVVLGVKAMDRAELEGRAMYLTAKAAHWKYMYELMKEDRDALLRRLKTALNVTKGEKL